MTEAVQIELIKSLTIVIPAVILSLGTTLGAFFSYRAAQHAKIAAEQSIKTEQNTNHMKDELVEEVRKVGNLKADAAYQTGKQDERDQSNKSI